MTVVSTGTWIVGLSDRFDPARLDESRGMTCNADAWGRLLAGALTMGGREFSRVAAPRARASGPTPAWSPGWSPPEPWPCPPSATRTDVPGSAGAGRIAGPPPETPAERRALAVLYTALLTSVCLDALGSDRLVVLDGSFVRDPLYAGLVAAFRRTRHPGGETLFNLDSQGTAAGSALLADHDGRTAPVPIALETPPEPDLPGLADYRARWLELARVRRPRRYLRQRRDWKRDDTAHRRPRPAPRDGGNLPADERDRHQPGTAGNLSARFGDGFLITPSSLPYDRMEPDDLVEMAFDGTYVGRRPSSEWRFHRDILRQRTDIEVVLHCHSIYATTLACHHKTIPSFHYMTGVRRHHDPVREICDLRDPAAFRLRAGGAGGPARLPARPARPDLAGQDAGIRPVAGQRGGDPVAHVCPRPDAGRAPVLPDEEMARVIEQMRRMSYGQAPDLDGINDVARPRQAGA